ncbi:hypothetical protein ADL27_38680 [Streptomyces sp. NRRL F-6602]|nr:hypothetical protein ADL27_38680 [Streptomyces sp. NRRL F-6602]
MADSATFINADTGEAHTVTGEQIDAMQRAVARMWERLCAAGLMASATTVDECPSGALDPADSRICSDCSRRVATKRGD